MTYSQTNYQFGGLQSINFNKEFKQEWTLNTKLESRQLFKDNLINKSFNKKYDYVLTDFSLIVGKKVGLHSRVAGGYLIRFEDGAIIHRFIQHYMILKKMVGWQLVYRISSEQFFSKIEKTEFRFRFRLTSEFPLNGESVDTKEFYLKLNNEYLKNFQDNKFDLEIRLIPFIGYSINDNLKIESGIDYRVNSFINNIANHTFWTTFNLFIAI